MNRKLLASAICASLFVVASTTAYAQDNSAPAPQAQDQSATAQSTQPSTDQNSNNKTKTLETVTVTGTLLKRPEYQDAVPIQVVPIEAQKATGAFSTADILQATSAAAGATQINNQFSGFVIGGGTGIQTINLRGLGANRTLVLLDGQRPGPAGTQGQTGSGFDLNVIPDVMLQRVEIVKDGSSSIYGSDAIAGVVNLITKKRLDHTELEAFYSYPQDGGGAQKTISIGTGFNFDKGNIVLAAEFRQQDPLPIKDRSFLSCNQDMVYGPDGNRIDRADHSILQGTSLAGCNNLYADTIIDAYDSHFRFNPTKDGSTIGPFPGYAPRPYPSTRYNDPTNPEGAYYTDVLNYPFSGDQWAINKNRNETLYGSSHFMFGNVTWDNQVLFNYRTTQTQGWRQFFPLVIGPTDTENTSINSYYGVPNNELPFGLYEPIMPFPSNNEESVRYLYLRTALSGGFGDSSWSWAANLTHSRSSGSYGHLGIDAARTADCSYSQAACGDTPDEYFSPGYLSGQDMGQLIQRVGYYFQGHTTYSQTTANFTANGDLFELPAGPVVAAVGAEFRTYAINDQPDPYNASGGEWGYSSAQVTKGRDHVNEVFGELGVPLLKDLPGVQNLAIDMSARAFKYGSVANGDKVWKFGMNWQIVPTVRVRGSLGTSYRAPGLYELYLGNESGFLSQTQIDPCIDWADPSNTNSFLRAHCAAAGIPGNYAGGGSSAQIFQGGGAGFLKPETSRAKTVGIVWTPAFGNFNMALDYFDYKIRGEITTLGASTILRGCYGTPVYPNDFCNMFTRNPPDAATAPNAITNVYATFVNINRERERGYDLQFNWSNDFSFGKLSADAEVTYTLSDVTQLFSTSAASGFNDSNRVKFPGNPLIVGLAHVSWNRGDWTVTWQGEYTGSTAAYDAPNPSPYFGVTDATYKLRLPAQFRHSLSVGYDTGKWGVTGGVRNLFNAKPPQVSNAAGVDASGLVGNTIIDASQYDWFGRTYFVRANYSF
jgi:iron complex outermembrane receptor protein